MTKDVGPARSSGRNFRQRAVAARRGETQALIVVNLDQLHWVSRIGFPLCEQYFSDGKPWSLLSVTDSLIPRS